MCCPLTSSGVERGTTAQQRGDVFVGYYNRCFPFRQFVAYTTLNNRHNAVLPNYLRFGGFLPFEQAANFVQKEKR